MDGLSGGMNLRPLFMPATGAAQYDAHPCVGPAREVGAHRMSRGLQLTQCGIDNRLDGADMGLGLGETLRL